MKRILIIILIFIPILLVAQNETDVKLLDKSLQPFLNVRDFCISNEGDEAFFTIQSPGQEISQIASIRIENNEWSVPELLPFCDSFMYLEPFLTVDGNRLFFVSDRPLRDSARERKDFDIWYVERINKNTKWSNPINIGQPINTELNEFYPSISKNNNLYFTLESPNGFGKDDIYFSKWENKKYSNPILLDENINSIGYEFNAFISQNEDFIIYTKYNEKDGQGSGDLYISKKDNNNNWQKARNIGTPINTKYMEYCPFYDQKNELLYFTSKRNDLETRQFESVFEINKYINENKNGLSKIYKTSFKIE